MSNDGWSLEVVRGRETGRRFAVSRGETVLGNALNGSPGLDLGDQETAGPRRMASRQAQIECSAQGLTVRDLDSPGGTFVNRQRVLPGKAQALQPGDVIQVGNVQLKVVPGGPPPLPAAAPPPAKTPPTPSAAPPPVARSTPPPPAPPKPPPAPAASAAPSAGLPAPFVLASGAVCRSWDDFLTISAQRWPALRDELTSGRLGSYLVSIRRPSLAPAAHAPGTADEQLDAWLATLPTTRPSQPELEVHPPSLVVRAVPGGGRVRQTLQVTNTGYRLLRSTVRVEADAAPWVRVAPEFTGVPFVTVDQSDIPVDIEIPESLDRPKVGTLLIDSNGGTRRVEIRVERPPAPTFIEPAAEEGRGGTGAGLIELIAARPPGVRLAFTCLGAVVLRLMIALGGLLPAPGATPDEAVPRLWGAAVVFAIVGAFLAAVLASKRGAARDLPPAGFAGACAGIFLAALAVAACRSIEPMLGLGASPSLFAASPAWAAIGAGLGAASVFLIPASHAKEAAP